MIASMIKLFYMRLELKDQFNRKETLADCLPSNLLKRQLCVSIGLRGQVQERGS